MSNGLNRQIDTWWEEFSRRANDLDDLFAGRQKWDLPAWMFEQLQAIHRGLMWEFGPAAREKGHRLVITPESRRYLRPLVRRILDRAPKLEGWEFYGYRLPEDLDAAEDMVQVRSGGSIAKTFFRATIGEFNRIDLCFLSRDYASNEDRQALHDVFVASETLLGEEYLDRWIGAIEVARWNHGPEEPQPLANLRTEVDHLVDQVQARLPDQPCYLLPDDLARWSLYELEPEPADEYPRQDDMFVGKAMIQPMWINAHRRQSFDSIRFSKHGEIFCYVKLDGSQGLDEEKFADKGEIEDALDDALRNAEVGCFIGGGTGLRYSYVDLALTDVRRGAEIVRRVLQDGNIPKRSWLLFFDTDLEAEWIGIWDDTPPPPMPDFEARHE